VRFVRISSDVWVNLKHIESVTRNVDGTALLQGNQRIYASTIPFDAILMQGEESEHESMARPKVSIQSPLLSETQPAW